MIFFPTLLNKLETDIYVLYTFHSHTHPDALSLPRVNVHTLRHTYVCVYGLPVEHVYKNVRSGLYKNPILRSPSQ